LLKKDPGIQVFRLSVKLKEVEDSRTMTLSFILVNSYSIFDNLVSKRVLKSSLKEWISEVISILL
jgi:hypothetical protein